MTRTVATDPSPSENDLPDGLLIGWACTDLTPQRPVLITGQFYARRSEGVRDPILATAMAFESRRAGRAAALGVMVSCDLIAIPNSLRDAVRQQLRQTLPDLDPAMVFLNATHTHTGPAIRLEEDRLALGGSGMPSDCGIDLQVMPTREYAQWAAERIADAVARAWRQRQPGGIGYGLGHATIGYNRRMCFYSGETRMYGNPDDPDFSHIEAGSENSVNTLFTWDRTGRLTGVIVNVTCPSQVSEHEYCISADYWHEARQELRARLGQDLFILPQNSASGDICPGRPSTMIDFRAQERMWRLMGVDQRRDIGCRLAEAVTGILPYARREVVWDPPVAHRCDTVELPRRRISPEDVQEALAAAEPYEKQYEELKRELESNPRLRQQPRWYKPISTAFRRMHWYRAVAERFEHQKQHPMLPIEVHVLRLGDVAMATNPFEYYLDFGHQIRARSKAVQTFLVQHVGIGTYLPTARAAAGKSYGAVPASTPVGPEGGKRLADWTVDAINHLWTETPPQA